MASLIKALVSFMKVLPSLPNRLQKVPPPNIITFTFRFQHMNSGRQDIQTVAVVYHKHVWFVQIKACHFNFTFPKEIFFIHLFHKYPLDE